MMNRVYKRSLLLAAAILTAGISMAQLDPDRDNLSGNKEDMKSLIKLSGTINATTSVYTVSKIQNRRPPFKFNVYGTPSLQIKDLVIPVRFTFGTYQNKFRQEFNRLGISPKYKNLTVHLGHSSVSFSPLALQGHNFLGAGVEWNPSNLRLAYIYGRFQRKIEPDSISFFQDNILPNYSRTGMGLKAGYGKNGNYIDIIAFKGRDLKKSLSSISSWQIPNPAENAVLALSLRQKILGDLQISGDIALSAYTLNTDDQVMDPDRFVLGQLPAFLIKDRSSTQYLKAIQTSLKYKFKSFKIPFKDSTYLVENMVVDLKYDRIDPGYCSMGTYFFRNDLERFSFNASFQSLQDRLTISLPLGFEHNNLFRDQQSTNRRLIGGLNARYKHSEDLQVNLTASNFRSRLYQEWVPDYDTLVVNQVDRNFNLAADYLLNRDGKKNKINARIGYQSGKNITLDKPVSKLAKVFLVGSYSFASEKYDLTLTPGLGMYLFRFTQYSNFRAIPSVNAKKSFMDKKLDVSYDLGLIISNGLFGIRNQARLNYQINKKQGVSLQLFLVNNLSSFNSFTEFQMDLRWYYRL